MSPDGGVCGEASPGDSPSGPDELYAPLVRATGRYAIAQLGQSLDGRIATRTGDAQFVTGAVDRAHLHRLRSLVDAVVVGVGTVASDDPRLTVRAVAGRHPHRVLLDPRGGAPLGSRLLSDGADTTWVVAAGTDVGSILPSSVRIARLPVGDDGFDPAAVLDLLVDLGLPRVLVEGGGRTVSAFLRAGVLDRMHLSVAPVLLGAGGRAGIELPGPALARDAARPPSRTFRLGEDVCFDLDLSGPGHSTWTPQAPAASVSTGG